MCMDTRRVPPGCGIAIGIILGLMLWFSLIGLATAQEPRRFEEDSTGKVKVFGIPQTFLVYVDTAGVVPVGVGMYVTWVFAKASPNAYPSSGVLVAWDCLRRPRMVKRLAQVVYHMTPDSTGVTGNIEEVDRPWQPVTDERMANLVCEVGPTHGTGQVPPPKPQSPYSDA